MRRTGDPHAALAAYALWAVGPLAYCGIFRSRKKARRQDSNPRLRQPTAPECFSALFSRLTVFAPRQA
jgi:hypothetical protein